jgi:tellurite resistance protein TehA-like permease
MLWSIVFPLGMYAAATFRLSAIAAMPALAFWSLIVAWVALAAWCATAADLVLVSVRSAQTLIGFAHLFGNSAARRQA